MIVGALCKHKLAVVVVHPRKINERFHFILVNITIKLTSVSLTVTLNGGK
jgi:hypothetical protein